LSKLTQEDLELMDIGNCLDYFEEYAEFIAPAKKKNKKRMATQEDFDRF
jgi:hypothetical protein